MPEIFEVLFIKQLATHVIDRPKELFDYVIKKNVFNEIIDLK